MYTCKICDTQTEGLVNNIPICANCRKTIAIAQNRIQTIGIKNHKLLETLEGFCHSTGSRFFGNAKPDSDWDFFCSCTETHIIKLIELGFSRDTHYRDSSISYVYSYTDTINIHVQVIKEQDFRAKLELHHNLDFIHLIKYLPKESHRVLWNFTLSLIRNKSNSVE